MVKKLFFHFFIVTRVRFVNLQRAGGTYTVHGFKTEVANAMAAGYLTGSFCGAEKTATLFHPVKPVVWHR